METINEFKISPKAQQICSLLHFGWVPKKVVGNLEQNLVLYREVELYLSLMGYELINPSSCEWYIIRLKKEFDNEAFDRFYKHNRALNKNHMALITILYAKLILPKKIGHADSDADLHISFDELVFQYGEKFKRKNKNPKGIMETLLKTLLNQFFITVKDKTMYYPGPSMYMLHEELMTDTCAFIIQNITDSINLSLQAKAESIEDDEEELKNDEEEVVEREEEVDD